MINEPLFREAVNEKGLKLKAVADMMGVRPSTLYRKMKGQLDFSRKEIQVCSEIFGRQTVWRIFFDSKVT